MIERRAIENTVYLIRGLPGSGKSTLAQRIAPSAWFEADQFFLQPDGAYAFDPAKLGDAHAACQEGVWKAMQQHLPVIAVSNTFTQRWEVEPYRVLARLQGYTVVEMTMNSAFGSTHGVPQETIDKMKARWEA